MIKWLSITYVKICSIKATEGVSSGTLFTQRPIYSHAKTFHPKCNTVILLSNR